MSHVAGTASCKKEENLCLNNTSFTKRAAAAAAAQHWPRSPWVHCWRCTFSICYEHSTCHKQARAGRDNWLVKWATRTQRLATSHRMLYHCAGTFRLVAELVCMGERMDFDHTLHA